MLATQVNWVHTSVINQNMCLFLRVSSCVGEVVKLCVVTFCLWLPSVIGVQRTKVVVVGSVIESDRKLIVELQLNWGWISKLKCWSARWSEQPITYFSHSWSRLSQTLAWSPSVLQEEVVVDNNITTHSILVEAIETCGVVSLLLVVVHHHQLFSKTQSCLRIWKTIPTSLS